MGQILSYFYSDKDDDKDKEIKVKEVKHYIVEADAYDDPYQYPFGRYVLK
jgi:hypothetical protein